MAGFNHHSGCTCGWCESRGFGSWRDTISVQQSTTIRDAEAIQFLRRNAPIRSATTCFLKPNVRCPRCDELVFFYANEHGSRVYFDEIGPPWTKHGCMISPSQIKQRMKPLLRQPSLGRMIFADILASWHKSDGVKTAHLTQWRPYVVLSETNVGIRYLLRAQPLDLISGETIEIKYINSRKIIDVSDIISVNSDLISAFDQFRLRHIEFRDNQDLRSKPLNARIGQNTKTQQNSLKSDEVKSPRLASARQHGGLTVTEIEARRLAFQRSTAKGSKTMHFRIADTFTAALARLPTQEQKAVKTSAFDMQLNPSAPGLQFHRIEASKDPNFWSMRVNRDIRIIVHRTAASLLLAYVDHHDKAYAWAERRRIEAHPRTGAVQIVESRARVEESAPTLFKPPAPERPAPEPVLFVGLSDEDLLSIGLPEDWIEPVRAATESQFFDLASHLPAEAAEGLLEYAATGRLPKPESRESADPFAHPDTQRRFRIIENLDALRAALDAPWERWSVFLHPSQKGVIERSYGGPARVAGSAGTGKTVVALHRAVRLARSDPHAQVLLTTFSKPLADALQRKVDLLVAVELGARGRITIAPWDGLAEELHQLVQTRRPRLATLTQTQAALVQAAGGTDVWSERFLLSEFRHVVDAWQVADEAAYADTPRPGRRSRLGARQRAALWPIFTAARTHLANQGLVTWAQVYGALTAHYEAQTAKPFSHVVVDEAQDLSVPELKFLHAIVPEGADRLFFAGDLGQRIFQPPFSWKALGVDVRGRSTTLKVNYRTSHQIREAADQLLPGAVHDMDGREEARKGTVSVFNGPKPNVQKLDDEAAEREAALAFISAARADGIAAYEIGLFVRSRAQLDRARSIAHAAGLVPIEPGDAVSDADRTVTVGTMHLAKGLEFKAVVVLACDDGVLPLQERIDTVSDEAELEEVYETERHLLYVACTRARDRLLITGTRPGSEFLDDLG